MDTVSKEFSVKEFAEKVGFHYKVMGKKHDNGNITYYIQECLGDSQFCTDELNFDAYVFDDFSICYTTFENRSTPFGLLLSKIHFIILQSKFLENELSTLYEELNELRAKHYSILHPFFANKEDEHQDIVSKKESIKEKKSEIELVESLHEIFDNSSINEAFCKTNIERVDELFENYNGKIYSVNHNNNQTIDCLVLEDNRPIYVFNMDKYCLHETYPVADGFLYNDQKAESGYSAYALKYKLIDIDDELNVFHINLGDLKRKNNIEMLSSDIFIFHDLGEALSFIKNNKKERDLRFDSVIKRFGK